MDFLRIIKKTLFLAFPIILSSLINAAVGIISMYLIALTGHEALAAGALISSTYSFFIMIAISLFFSISIMVGQHFGAGNYLEIGGILRQGFVLATLIAIPLFFIMQHIYAILIFFRQPQLPSHFVGIYFKGLSYGIFPTLWGVVLNQFLNATMRPQSVLFFSVTALLCNSLLGYLLLIGKWGLPKLGIMGVALAISFISWAFFIVMLFYLRLNKKFQIFHIFYFNRAQQNYYFQLLQLGWPISIQYGIEMLAFTVMTYLMGILGSQTLAAQQIALQCSLLAILIMGGFSQSTSILLAQNHGSRNFRELKHYYAANIICVTFFMILIGMSFAICPHLLISFFIDTKFPQNKVIVHLASLLLLIAALTQCFDGVRNITAAALRCLQDQRFPMWMGFFSCWILALPLSVLFAFYFKLGAVGIRLGFLIGISLCAMVLVYRVNSVLTVDRIL